MDEQEPKKGLSHVELAAIFDDAKLPRLYSGSFVVGNSATDMFIVGTANGQPQFVLNLSFSAAKELARVLSTRIKEIEENIGNEIKVYQIHQ